MFIALFLTIPSGAVFIHFNSIFSRNVSNSSVYAMGAVIIVDQNGTGDYLSIQDAINHALPGDHIIVNAGTYREQLTINVARLNITAASGESPTIDVSSYAVGIDVTAAHVLLDGFTIIGNGSRVGGPYPTIRANTGADGLVVNSSTFHVTKGYGWMALMIAAGVTNISFTNNIWENYATSLYHAARLFRTGLYYGSIQDAIDIAVSGDTIAVFPGIYDEQLAINKRIDLQGNGLGSVLQPTTSPTLGVYDVEIEATSAILEDLTFDFNGPTDTRSGNGIIVSDLSMPPVINVKIQNNIIYTGDANTGIHTGKYSDVSGLLISGNIFYGDADGRGEGVYVNPYTGTGKVTINHNQFYGNLSAGISIEASKVTASNNTIHNNITKGVTGIRYIDLTGGQIFSGVNITRNTITNMTYGIRIGTTTNVGSKLRAEILSNTIKNNDNGIWVEYGADLSNSVHKNSLAKNTNYGINNIGSSLVNATNNWWGDKSGPYHPVTNPSGKGVVVSNGVIFWPWYEFDAYSIPPYVQYLVGTPNGKGGTLIKDTTHIQIIARDNDSGLQSFKYRTWDALTRWSAWMDYTGDLTFSGDGLKIVQYNATDKAGTTTFGTKYHTLDTMAPTVNLIYPNGRVFLRGAATILWNAVDEIPDQRQETRNYYHTVSSNFPGHLQSFQPTAQKLHSIQLLLYGDDANVTVRLFKSITPFPIPIANSSQHLQNIAGNINNPVWIDFPFNTNVTLDTNATYYIGLSQKMFGPIGFYCYYDDSTGISDPYTYGHGWINETGGLISHPELDWCFRTMYWDKNIQIRLEYSPTGVSPWSTIADNEQNDGTYIWDTTRYPEGNNYRIRIFAIDGINNMGFDISDNNFWIDNTGPIVSNIVIKDSTLDRTDYTKNGDEVEISATVGGNPISIYGDLSDLGKGTNVPPTSFTGGTAKWLVSSINCTPANGAVIVRIIATDPNGDESGNLGTIISDNSPPVVKIIRPIPGVYFNDRMRHMHFSYPLVIGPITFRVEAQDTGSGIRTVEFYVQDVLKGNVSTAPYVFFWNERIFGYVIIKVIAYDTVGHTSTDTLNNFFILNFR